MFRASHQLSPYPAAAETISMRRMSRRLERMTRQTSAPDIWNAAGAAAGMAKAPGAPGPPEGDWGRRTEVVWGRVVIGSNLPLRNLPHRIHRSVTCFTERRGERQGAHARRGSGIRPVGRAGARG